MGQDKRFVKGLIKDTAHLDQPEGSWRYARNMILNETEGAISNEGGTELAGHLGTNQYTGAQNDKLVGRIQVDKDRAILCVLDVKSSTPRSEIGMWEKGVYTILFNPTITPTTDLNFKETHPITGTFKIDSKGDLIIYLTDDLNSPKAFNVDRQLRDSTGVSNLYGIANLNSINILNLFPYSGPIPRISIHDQYWKTPQFQKSTPEGGGLLTAVYSLSLAYVDKDLVATNYVATSNPVSIVEEFDHTRPTTKKDGAKDGSQTSKAIKWRVDNLNLDYKYLRPVIIRKMGDATEAFSLNLIEILVDSNNKMEIVFSGLEGSSPASVEEVMIDTTSYDKAKTVSQLDGVLYLGNLEGTKDIGFQKYANNIKLEAKVKEFTNFDEVLATMDNLQSGFGEGEVDYFDGAVKDIDDTKSYRYIPNIERWKGYQRDEVYAIYIAFVLNDGSMSYAYHIPGREASSTVKEIDNVSVLESDMLTNVDSSNLPLNDFTSTVIYDDLQSLSKAYARNFHFFDFSEISGNNNMNYWQNATELYPNTSNYEVWGLNGLAGNIGKTNVRHHHFPSNENEDMQTIVDETCEVVDTNSDIVVGTNPAGPDSTTANEFTFYTQRDPVTHTPSSILSQYYYLYNANEQVNNYPDLSATGASAIPSNISLANQLWNGNIFEANQTMNVIVSHETYYGHYSPFSLGGGSIVTNIQKLDAGTNTWVTQTTNTTNLSDLYQSGCPSNVQYGLIALSSGTTPISMVAGDKLRVTTEVSAITSIVGIMNHFPNSCTQTPSKVNFTVWSGVGEILDDWKKDVKISHTVQALGFTLSDIRIPKSIADKVQGFKIYYANRKHADKRILGQSVALPMQPDNAKVGLCEQAWSGSTSSGNGTSGDGEQILSTLQDSVVNILRKSPFPTWDSRYPTYSIYEGAALSPQENDNYGYKSFSFPGFNLLRTKNSIAGATHIKPEYFVRNFVWNGPTLKQDKKMISKIMVDNGPTSAPYSIPLKKVVEEWGYDTDLNCWAKGIASAFFVGKTYRRYQSKDATIGNIGHISSSSTFGLPRVISQKAKSYLKGDSIFNAEPLGFGGKVLNNGGESSLIFSLKDKHEFYAMDQSLSAAGNGFDAYGKYTDANPFYLSGEPGTNGRQRVSNIPIFNLHAFKTDMYKSIDTQDLIFTGFEVLGQDLQNFIFDDSNPAIGTPISFDYVDNGPLPNVNNYTADFSIETLQKDIQKSSNGSQIDSSQYHIFGGDTFICRYGNLSTLSGLDSKSSAQMVKGLHYHIVESSDNINFRHSESDDSLFFPSAPAKSVLDSKGDLNDVDNIKYNANYSALNDIKPVFPLPSNIAIQDDFPTRTHRSAKNDTSSLIDNYRIFLANQFKDLPKNRGELWKLSSFNNLLYFHMEDSLYVAKGKQQMQMKDGSEAFIGSGDIFSQEPDEIIQTEGGFGGTQSQYAALSTRQGYFFVNRKTKKVFLMQDKLLEISKLGLRNWFEDNMDFKLKEYGMTEACNNDNPILGFGFHSVYDPKNKRILLTKRDLLPTAAFIAGYELGNQSPPLQGKIVYSPSLCSYLRYEACKGGATCDPWVVLDWGDITYFKRGGWTKSYYPESKVWASVHDYVPYIYFNTSTSFYSLTDQYARPVWDSSSPASVATHAGTTFGNAGIWKHNSDANKGIFYQENTKNRYTDADWKTTVNYHLFEIEFIHNENRGVDTLLSSFSYTSEVFNPSGVNVLEHGFTKFFLYNTFQLSGESDLQYLVNTRRVGNSWKINQFRDMAAVALDTSPYYMKGTVANPNILGGVNVGTVTTSAIQPMFTVDGMSEVVNNGYLDLAKSWHQKKKFIDKWVGIRLIYDNISNNLLNLYSTNVSVRKMHR
jgi:hypothetical protein